MSFADSVANDFKITDGTSTVTFTSKPTSTTITVHYADSHEYTAREIVASQGLFNIGDRKWSLGNNQIGAAYKPKAGDSITDADGVVWELVLDATLDDFAISWVCQTRKAR